jgi:hypothetical protein
VFCAENKKYVYAYYVHIIAIFTKMANINSKTKISDSLLAKHCSDVIAMLNETLSVNKMF